MIRRSLQGSAVALFLWLAMTPVWACMMTLCGVGGPAAGGGAYVGPGDLLTYSAYYGLRAFSSATRGNKLVNVCNSTGGVDVGCADLSSDPTTGKLVGATISGIPCPGANCTIKTFYDLTSGLACGGATCDITQATVASRNTLPALGTCTNISASVACSVSQGNRYFSGNNPLTFVNPIFFTSTAQVLGSGTNLQIIGSNAFEFALFYDGGTANTPRLTCNQGSASLAGSATQTAPHSIGAQCDTTSYIDVDGTVNSGTLAFSGSSPSAISAEGNGFSQFIGSGSFFLEAGVGLSSITSTAMSAELANAKSFWGYP